MRVALKMTDKVEQHICMKFFQKLGYLCSETCDMIQKAFGNEAVELNHGLCGEKLATYRLGSGNASCGVVAVFVVGMLYTLAGFIAGVCLISCLGLSKSFNTSISPCWCLSNLVSWAVQIIQYKHSYFRLHFTHFQTKVRLILDCTVMSGQA
jgi:hypothetical protein